MGHKRDDSSESDEETNVRHDRFKSERFQESKSSRPNSSSSRIREEKYDKYSSKKHRDRSPRNHRDRIDTSMHRKESRNKYDTVGSYSKCNKPHKHEMKDQTSTSNKKHSNENDGSTRRDTNTNNPKKLSSLLMKFDKQVEERRHISETQLQIGPALPPHLVQKEEEKESSLKESQLESSVGPALPPHFRNSCQVVSDSLFKEILKNDVDDPKNDNSKEITVGSSHSETSSIMGPALPPHLQNEQILGIDNIVETQRESPKEIPSESVLLNPTVPTDEKSEVYGPMLPPKIDSNSYGPALPPNLKKHTVQGPALPSGMTADDLEKMGQEDSEDEDTVGPLPEGIMNMTQYQLDLRALDIKRKLEEEKSGPSKDVKKREEWMLELPPEKASNLGLGPRSFRMREGPDMSNRSAWTDTPADKKRKEDLALRGESEPVSSEEIMRTAFVDERNETMDKISQLNHDENRQKSLLEMHQKKLKKKKKKEEKDGKKKERRPFDRNVDLQVHRFDEAQKKAIFKKAQLLDTRFSSGESKYL